MALTAVVDTTSPGCGVNQASWHAPAVVRDSAEVTLALFYVCGGHRADEVAEHLHIAPKAIQWMLGMEIRRLTGTRLPINECLDHIEDLGLSPESVATLAGCH